MTTAEALSLLRLVREFLGREDALALAAEFPSLGTEVRTEEEIASELASLLSR